MKSAKALSSSLYLLAVFFVLFCLIIWWSFFTARGSSVSLSVLQNRMQNLDYTYRSGSLANVIALDDLNWQLQNKTLLRAIDIKIDWDPTCWRGKEFCLSSVSAKQLKIVIPPGSNNTNPTVLAKVELPFSLSAQQLDIDELVIEHPTAGPTVFKNVHFSGSVQESIIRASSVQLDWNWLRIESDGEMSLRDNYPVKLNASLTSLDQNLALPIVSDWKIAGDLLLLTLDGNISAPYLATANGTFSALDKTFPALIDLHWANVQWPPQAGEPTIAFNEGEFNISGNWPDYETTGKAIISGSSFPGATATLNGQFNTNGLTFNPLQLNTLGGTFDVIGSLKWRNGIAWNTRLAAKELWPDLYWQGVKGLVGGTTVFNGLYNNGQTRFGFTNLNAVVGLTGNSISIAGDVSRDATGTWHLSGLEATSRRNTLSANGSLGEDSKLNLYFSLNSPEDFLHDVKGDINGNIQIDGNIQQPHITGSASSSRLSHLDMTLSNTRINGILRAMGETESDVKVVADSLNINGHQLRDLTLNANGSLQDHLIRLALDSPPFTDQSLEAIGALDKFYNWQGKINVAGGQLADKPVRLATPVNVTWANDAQTLAIQPHCWEIDAASICASETALVGKNGLVNFSLDKLNLAMVNLLLPEHLTMRGSLSSAGKLKWGPSTKPEISVKTQISDVVLGISDENSSEKLDIELDAADLNISTRANIITTTFQSHAKNIGDIDAKLNVNTLQNNYPLSGNVSVTGATLDWLNAYFPQLQKLQGNVTANAAIGGTISTPVIDSNITVSDGLIKASPLPDIEDIQLQVDIADSKATMTGIARAGDSDVNLSGNGKLIDSNWISELQIKADKMQFSHDYVSDGQLSPDLKISVTPTRIDITGSVSVPKANIVINDLASGGVPVSSDVIIVDAVQRANDSTPNHSMAMNTNVNVLLGRDVRFSGYGLKADLGGDFNLLINGKHAPELLGNIRVDSGTYRSYGQDLIIRKGGVDFVGPLDQAALSVDAVRKVGSVLAGLRIDGSLGHPNITLFSEPAMPEEDILSYVVLGRQLDFQTKSTDDSQLLARAALFMGISNGRKISQDLAKNLGIDELTLSSAGSGDDTQVLVSGRINDRLLVRYGIGIFNSVSTLFVRYDLAEKLYLETTQGFAEGLEKAIDIFYSFDF